MNNKTDLNTILYYILWNALVIIALCVYSNIMTSRVDKRLCAMDKRLQEETSELSKSISQLIEEQKKLQGAIHYCRDYGDWVK